MFDIGGSELLVIGIVALIVVGPKDLPRMFHALGQFTAKARSMARDFQRAMESAADESGAGDIARDLKKMTSAKALGLDAVKQATKRLETWDEVKRSNKSGLEPDPEAPAPEARGPETEALAKERADKAAAEMAKLQERQSVGEQLDGDPEPPKPAKAPRTAKAAAEGGAAKASRSASAKSTAGKATTAKEPAAKTATKATTKTAAKAPKATTKTASTRAKPTKQSDA